jgi:cytochrome c oxidase accessory protein FixG
MLKDNQSFRDKIATVTEDGKRQWIYPKRPKGKFYNYRNLVSFLLIAFLFAGPFLKINDQPIILLDLLGRKFILFGLAFWPQDFHLFLLAMITLTLFIIVFTSIFGRVWCGWLCPQTVFMEMVFRKIEYWIEGDYKAQIKLDLGKGKFFLFKKILKHIVFYAISFLIANIFLAYIIGVERLFQIISEPISMHVSGFVAIQLFTFAFYGVFARFREQACVIVCPYARFQSVMVDENTITVAYDFKRGEERGFLSKKDKEAKSNTENFYEFGWEDRGDCVDCNLCIDVCPTGIDIRNGIQLECVNCTACMDACDTVMEKINRPKGLIRYSSLEAITSGKKRMFTARVKAYFLILTFLIAGTSYLISTRSDTETVILRQPGTLYQVVDNNHISNMYQFKVINKTFKNIDYEVKLLEPAGEFKAVGEFQAVKPQSLSEGKFFIILEKNIIKPFKTKVKFGIYVNNNLIETVETGFLGPEKL